MAARKRAGERPAKAGAAPQPSDEEVARLERLLELMHEHGLTELEIGLDGRSVRMSKAGPATYAVGAPLAASAGNPAAAPAAPAKATARRRSVLVRVMPVCARMAASSVAAEPSCR